MAETCFKKSNDYNSLLLFYSSYGDEAGLQYLLEESEKNGKFNIAFESAYLLALPERCVQILMKSKRYSEAGMFAKSYIPHLIPEVMKEWSKMLEANSLQFVPENIFESTNHKEQMVNSLTMYQEINRQLY